MIDDSLIATYTLALRRHLARLPAANREDLVREITTHIHDASGGDGGSVAETLRRLGPPEQLAAQYCEGIFLEQAKSRFAPMPLLRACFRIGTRSLMGMLVFVTGLFGYLLGAGLVMTGLLKPFLASRTGLWISDGRMVASGVQYQVPLAPAREVLGWWAIPLALVLGCLLLVVTTLLIRMFLRLGRHVQGYLPAGVPRAAFGVLVLLLAGLVGSGAISRT